MPDINQEKSDESGSRFLSARQASKIIGCSTTLVCNWLKDGRLTGVYSFEEKKYLISIEQVVWIRDNRDKVVKQPRKRGRKRTNRMT